MKASLIKRNDIIRSVFILCVLWSCNNQENERLIVTGTPLGEINNSGEMLILYYHSGDCSICYGTLGQISHDFPESTIISLSSSKNIELMKAYLEQIEFNGISLIDSSNVFFVNNRKLLSMSNLFLIDNHHNILFKSINYNRQIRIKIKNIIKKKTQ